MSDAQSPLDREGESGTRADKVGSGETPLEAEAFGVKLKTSVSPRPAGDPDRRAGPGMAQDQQALDGLRGQLFRGPPGRREGFQDAVRGLGALPGAVAERIGRAREQADRREDALQAKAPVVSPITPEKALENAEDIFGRLQAKGVAAGAYQLEDGRWVFYAVRPELEDATGDCAHAMLEGPKERSVKQTLELTQSVDALLEKGTALGAEPPEERTDDADIAEAAREDKNGGADRSSADTIPRLHEIKYGVPGTRNPGHPESASNMTTWVNSRFPRPDFHRQV